MAFQAGFRSRVLVGDFSLSAYVTDADMPWTCAMDDITTLADNGVKRCIPDLDSSTVSVKGWLDTDATSNLLFDQVTDLKALGAAEPWSYAPRGFALGNEVLMAGVLEAQFKPGSKVGSAVSFGLNGTTDGTTDYGFSLHDLTAAVGAGNGTGVDQTVVSTTAGAVAHLHVTAFSGFTNITVLVADSADNSSFATIGTFAVVTGLTSERMAVAGTIRRYIRYQIAVTGSGSVTFAAAFSRR